MRREAGFSLAELMIVTVLLVIVTGTLAAVARTIHLTDRQSAAYVDDLDGLRRAMRALERDLRAARHANEIFVDDTSWTHVNGNLWRNQALVARRVETFEIRVERGVATVRLALAPRADVPAARRPVLETRVRLRGAEAAR